MLVFGTNQRHGRGEGRGNQDAEGGRQRKRRAATEPRTRGGAPILNASCRLLEVTAHEPIHIYTDAGLSVIQ